MISYVHKKITKRRHIMTDTRKIISVRVEPNLHKQLKIIAIEKNTTLQNYIIELIKKDITQYKNKDD